MMVSTRSQAASRNTRSSGRSTLSKGLHVSRNRRQTKIKSKTTKIVADDPKTVTFAHLMPKVEQILWNLIEKYFPGIKIVMDPFKGTIPTSLFITVAAVMIFLCAYSGSIILYASGFWQDFFTDEQLPSIYFNEVSWAPRHRWMWREEEVLNITKEIEFLCNKHNGKQVHVYLIGGPGSGKSELARQVGLRLYESTKRQNKGPTDVMTIDGASVTSLLSSLLDAVFSLCNNTGQKADGMKQMKEELSFRFSDLFSNEETIKTERKFKVVFAKLKELLKVRNSRPVLIFDNVKDTKLLFDYLNLEPGSEQYSNFVIIITLQKRISLERLSDYVRVKDMYEGMLPADSVKLLHLITGLDNDTDARKLSDILGQQPLAVATAAIYIESVREGPPKRSNYTYSDYIIEFKKDIYFLGMEEEVEWRESDASKYAGAMFTAVLKAVNRSAQYDPVVREIACLGYTDSSPLSLSFILDFLNRSSHHFTEAQIRTSLRNVLFKVRGKEGVQTLSSHQVIREAFRQVCKVSCRNSYCLNTTICKLESINGESSPLAGVFTRLALSFEHELNATIYNINNINASLSESNEMFGYQCLDILASMCIFATREHLKLPDIINPRLSTTFLRLVSHGSGFWPGLIKATTNEFRLNEIVVLSNLLARSGERFDLQTLLLVVCLHSGATKEQNHGLMTAINSTTLGIGRLMPVSREKPLLLNILGVMYRGLGYPYKSKDLHKLALELYRSNIDLKYSKIREQENALGEAGTLHKLGIIYRYLGNLVSAQTIHETSVKLLQRLFGSHHPYIAGSLLNLAVVYSRQGRYRDALRLHNRSLAILKQTHGSRHAYVGTVLITMGTVYYKTGDFTTAIQFTKQGHEILEEAHGAWHPRVAEALNFLGFMYRDKGELTNAQECLERSVSIKEHVFDANHFILGEALNDLGVVYTRLGNAAQAISALNRALNIFRRTWGDSHTAVTTTLNSLGEAYCILGESHKAVFLHQKAQETLLKMVPGKLRDHLLAETRQLLGNAYLAMGNVDDAREMYRLAYSGFSGVYDRQHWRAQQALSDLNSVGSKTPRTSMICALLLIATSSVSIHSNINLLYKKKL